MGSSTHEARFDGTQVYALHLCDFFIYESFDIAQNEGGAKRFRSKSFAGRGSDPSGSDRTDPALKMPLAEAIGLLQLVDRTVLEGMGPPTVGFDARSELPTDPHGPSGASGGRTSVATRIS